jgi:hypothetical protein
MTSRYLLLCSALSIACSPGGNGRRDGGGELLPDGGFRQNDGRVIDPRFDAGPPFDPFDPDNACGISVVPTERVPGHLLVLFDRSSSMDTPPSGESGATKWELAVAAINSVLGTVSDELSMGLLLFPTGEGSECDVSLSGGVPQVPVGLLSETRATILELLETADPEGGDTAMFDALRAGWNYLDTLDVVGQRGVVLVSDGADTCDESDGDAVLMQAATELRDNDYLTFVVGLDQSNNELSSLAFNGGTPRNDTCLPECTMDLCRSDADCPGAGTCSAFAFGFGFCACSTDADCVSPQTCEAPPFCVPLPGFPCDPTCAGESNCCHYNAASDTFQADFEMALAEISRRFLQSCVFEVPRGADPSTFDPSLVNVGVTFEGEMRTVLPQSDDDSTNSWDYTDDTHRTLEIQGPICDRLLMSPGNVEIVLGCPTILI